MREPRIFHPQRLETDSIVILRDSAANHVARVLRLPNGAKLTLFDGSGDDFPAIISNLGKRQVTVNIIEKRPGMAQSPLDIHLGQGISRGERMDWVVQKATELGVQQITPLITDRCTVKLSQERWQKRLKHWQAVANSACEQCGRSQLLLVNRPKSLLEWLAEANAECNILLTPQMQSNLSIASTAPNNLRLLIGPEGGLTQQECAQAIQRDFQAINLGQRILRTETAAIAAVSILQYQWGDFPPFA